MQVIKIIGAIIYIIFVGFVEGVKAVFEYLFRSNGNIPLDKYRIRNNANNGLDGLWLITKSETETQFVTKYVRSSEGEPLPDSIRDTMTRVVRQSGILPQNEFSFKEDKHSKKLRSS